MHLSKEAKSSSFDALLEPIVLEIYSENAFFSTSPFSFAVDIFGRKSKLFGILLERDLQHIAMKSLINALRYKKYFPAGFWVQFSYFLRQKLYFVKYPIFFLTLQSCE